MPSTTPPSILRRAGALLTGVSLLVTLAGCSAGRDETAAREAAHAYLKLVAEGDADDLQALWSTTFHIDPGALRIAGELLVGATERIEIVEVGAATPTLAPTPDLDLELAGRPAFSEFRQIEVTYRLADAQHVGRIELAADAGSDRQDPASWIVTGPLLGELDRVVSGPPGSDLALYVAGIPAADGQYLYPARYEVEGRADPYLATDRSAIAVRAGETVTVDPASQLRGTEETAAALQAELVARFDDCASARLSCPLLGQRGYDRLREGGIIDPGDGTWWLGLVAEPTVILSGTSFTTTDGQYRYRLDNGDLIEARAEITGTWGVSVEGTPYIGDDLTFVEVGS